MITITEVAQAHFRKLLAEHDEDSVNIRVFVSNPGTPRAECGVSYCPEDAVERDDVTLSFDGFFTYIDAKSAPYLEEAVIDYKTDEMGGQLTLKAPNAKARKVADDAPLVDRINYLVEAEINPQLANHGGHCTLIEVTQEGEAIFQFGGGCQGCGMIDVTLKDGIQQTLLEKFPGEITGVKDITEHAAGENPYY